MISNVSVRWRGSISIAYDPGLARIAVPLSLSPSLLSVVPGRSGVGEDQNLLPPLAGGYAHAPARGRAARARRSPWKRWKAPDRLPCERVRASSSCTAATNTTTRAPKDPLRPQVAALGGRKPLDKRHSADSSPELSESILARLLSSPCVSPLSLISESIRWLRGVANLRASPNFLFFFSLSLSFFLLLSRLWAFVLGEGFREEGFGGRFGGVWSKRFRGKGGIEWGSIEGRREIVSKKILWRMIINCDETDRICNRVM